MKKGRLWIYKIGYPYEKTFLSAWLADFLLLVGRDASRPLCQPPIALSRAAARFPCKAFIESPIPWTWQAPFLHPIVQIIQRGSVGKNIRERPDKRFTNVFSVQSVFVCPNPIRCLPYINYYTINNL